VLLAEGYCGGAPRRQLNSVDFGGFQRLSLLVLHVTGMEV